MQDAIKQFNLNKKALVLDKSVAIRKAVESCLLQLGVLSDNIYSVSRFHDAQVFINKEKPYFVFTEFEIGSRFGLELIYELNQMGISPAERAFFMVTSNAQDSAIAEAAEEDVDGYILKPFSVSILEQQVRRTIEDKLTPSNYLKRLHQGQLLLEGNKPEEAFVILSEVLELPNKTALAYYYMGQCKEKLGDDQAAFDCYYKGLRLHPGHYKCLLGEYEVLERLGRQNEAYTSIKNIILRFPVTPSRLGKAFILAIHSKHFDDIEFLYEFYLREERRSEELVKIVTAGLFAAGKHFCTIDKFQEAFNHFKKASATSGRNPEYLKKIIETLLAFKQADLAHSFLSHYSAELQNTTLWKYLDFEITCFQGQKDLIVQKGRILISEGVQEVSVYIKTASLLREMNRHRQAENVIYLGIERCPDHRAELAKLID